AGTVGTPGAVSCRGRTRRRSRSRVSGGCSDRDRPPPTRWNTFASGARRTHAPCEEDRPPGRLGGSPLNKVVSSAKAALKRAGVQDGMTILAGGFGLCGIPENLIAALVELKVKNLTIVSNNAGVDDFGFGLLLATRQVKKMVSSYVGENDTFERQFLDGSLEVEFVPQGTLAERIRAGGAGIPAFFTPTGAGTPIAEGKEGRVIDGVECGLERAMRGDVSIVKAWKADHYGNLVYRMSARNFNPMIATAGRVTIAEVEKIVSPGKLDPDHVHTPGVYVDYVVRAKNPEKRIEQRTVRPRAAAVHAAPWASRTRRRFARPGFAPGGARRRSRRARAPKRRPRPVADISCAGARSSSGIPRCRARSATPSTPIRSRRPPTVFPSRWPRSTSAGRKARSATSCRTSCSVCRAAPISSSLATASPSAPRARCLPLGSRPR